MQLRLLAGTTELLTDRVGENMSQKIVIVIPATTKRDGECLSEGNAWKAWVQTDRYVHMSRPQEIRDGVHQSRQSRGTETAEDASISRPVRFRWQNPNWVGKRQQSLLTISSGSVPGLVSAAHSVGMTNTNSSASPDDRPWGVLDSQESATDKNTGHNSDGRTHVSGTVLGYARVSRNEQELARQFDALHAAGCTRVFYDKGISGARFDRPGLTEALNYARAGDTLTVQALDRLGRSTKGVLELAERLERSGVALRILNLGLDTATPSGKLVLTVIAAIAEMERDQLRERTLDGLAAARARGRVGGRPSALSEERRETVRSLYDSGASYAEIARILLVSERTVRRALGGK